MKHEIIYERDELFDVNMVIVFQIEIAGTYQFDKFKEAFENAIKVNRTLMSRVLLEADGRAYYVDNDVPKSSIREVDEELDLVRQREEKKRFHVEEGEFLRAFVKKNEEDTSILLLMHHLGGDGKSVLYFIEDFMTFLSGGTKEFKEIRTAETEKKLDPISKGILRYYNSRWNGKVFNFDDLDKAYEAYWKNRTSLLDVQVIEKEEMEDILAECRRAGVKYTAYLTAKLISEESGKMDVGYAVDYRHDKNRSMGNQASGTSVEHKYDPSKSLMQNAKEIQKKLDKKMKDHYKSSYILNFVGGIDRTLRDAVNLEHAGYYHDKVSYGFAKLMGYVGKTKDYSITNLTVADIPAKYGEYEIKQILFAGPVVSYGKRIIGVVTFNGKTVITKHVRKPE